MEELAESGGVCCLVGSIVAESDGFIDAVELRGVPPALLSLLRIAGGEYCVGAEAGFMVGAGAIGVIGCMVLVCALAS